MNYSEELGVYDDDMVQRCIAALHDAGFGGQERWQPNNSETSVSNEYLAHLVLNAAFRKGRFA